MLYSSITGLSEGDSEMKPLIVFRMNQQPCFQTIHKINEHNISPYALTTQKYTVNTTKSAISIPAPEPPLKSLPFSMHHVYVNTFCTSGKIHTDLPGHFRILSNSGNRSLLKLYDYKINKILSEPIKNISTSEILGHAPKL